MYYNVSATAIQERPPGCFTRISLTTPRRFRLEKRLYLEASRSPDGILKPLLDQGGGFTSETAELRFQK
jgi:hypothetical protein